MKNLSRILVLAAAIVSTTAAAFAWGNAAHVYVADRLGAKYPLQNTFELYGVLLPDLYTYSFDSTSVMMDALLQTSDGTIYRSAWNRNLKSVAFGFLAHAAPHGADATAHTAAVTIPGEGYIVHTAGVLAPELYPTLVEILMNGGLDESTAQYMAGQAAPVLAHDVVETAIDLLVKRQDDKFIGAKIAAAALARPSETPELLCAVYAKDLAAYAHLTRTQAKARITADEAAYRKMIIQYGTLFCLPENTAIAQLSASLAPVAESFLEAAVPLDFTVTPAQVESFLRKAMLLAAPSYKAELTATVAWVRDQLNSAGVTNTDSPFVFWKEGAGEQTLCADVPKEFALGQNYPNPFNPTTTVKYAVSETRMVRLTVHDMLGREVATLVNEVKEPGIYTTTWNASGCSSG
ncbi:MAG TPA: hypothetical protein VK470_15055, partial [Bacteroidota bacterium]|nr:hypothetical protein [Bacteroidota bacterium]